MLDDECAFHCSPPRREVKTTMALKTVQFWCDADQMADPVTFEADLVRFEAVRIEFAKNVESPIPAKRA